MASTLESHEIVLKEYVECLKISLTEAHKLNVQIPTDTLVAYNVHIIGNLGVSCNEFLKEKAKSIFKKAKTINEKFSSRKKIALSSKHQDEKGRY